MGCGLVDNSPFLRVAHSAHSPDDGVGIFSIVKWVLFELSRFRRNRPSGYFFDCQMGTFSFDKHTITKGARDAVQELPNRTVQQH